MFLVLSTHWASNWWILSIFVSGIHGIYKGRDILATAAGRYNVLGARHKNPCSHKRYCVAHVVPEVQQGFHWISFSGTFVGPQSFNHSRHTFQPDLVTRVFHSTSGSTKFRGGVVFSCVEWIGSKKYFAAMWRWKVQDLILKFWDLYRCTVGFEGCWTWRREASFTSWRCIHVYTIEMLECASCGDGYMIYWYIYTHSVYIVCWSHAMDRWRGWSDGWMAGCVDPEHGIILAHVGWNGARKKIQKIQWGLRRLNLYVQT